MYKRHKMIGAILTVLLHLCLIFFLLIEPVPVKRHPNPKPNKEPASVKVTLIPLAVSEAATAKKTGWEDRPTQVTDAKLCKGQDKTYKGIGILIQFATDIITYVPESYPAYLAGIRAGDVIIDLGDDGDVDRVVLNRLGTVMTFTVKKKNICYQETVDKDK